MNNKIINLIITENYDIDNIMDVPVVSNDELKNAETINLIIGYRLKSDDYIVHFIRCIKIQYPNIKCVSVTLPLDIKYFDDLLMAMVYTDVFNILIQTPFDIKGTYKNFYLSFLKQYKSLVNAKKVHTNVYISEKLQHQFEKDDKFENDETIILKEEVDFYHLNDGILRRIPILFGTPYQKGFV